MFVDENKASSPHQSAEVNINEQEGKNVEDEDEKDEKDDVRLPVTFPGLCIVCLCIALGMLWRGMEI